LLVVMTIAHWHFLISMEYSYVSAILKMASQPSPTPYYYKVYDFFLIQYKNVFNESRSVVT
jgi:hypothetical protein